MNKRQAVGKIEMVALVSCVVGRSSLFYQREIDLV